LLLIAHENFSSVKWLYIPDIAFAVCIRLVTSPQIREPLQLLFRDGLNIAENVPFDALGAGWECERALVAPKVSQVKRSEEALNANLLVSFVFTLSNGPNLIKLS
jgi:hypothetical protein